MGIAGVFFPNSKASDGDSRKRKLNRKKGHAFEFAVRNQLEKEGWNVAKWTNKIIDNEMVQCKPAFNPYKKLIMNSGGFPDFIAFRRNEENTGFIVIGVEAKYNGYVDPKERQQCAHYLRRGIFDKILIARHSEDGIFFVTWAEKKGEQY